METAISIIGTVASIVGTILSILAWRGAVSAMKKATAVRDEIVRRRSLGEVSALHKMTQHALRAAGRVGPTCTRDSIRGVVTGEVAHEIEEYRSLLKEYSGLFAGGSLNAATVLSGELSKPIEDLSEASDFERIKFAGKTIHSLIGDFLPIIKKRMELCQTENVENSS